MNEIWWFNPWRPSWPPSSSVTVRRTKLRELCHLNKHAYSVFCCLHDSHMYVYLLQQTASLIGLYRCSIILDACACTVSVNNVYIYVYGSLIVRYKRVVRTGCLHLRWYAMHEPYISYYVYTIYTYWAYFLWKHTMAYNNLYNITKTSYDFQATVLLSRLDSQQYK